MSTPPQPNLTISARYLGPVLSLDGELAKRKQNLIFARNGTGKSFLSRGLRFLDAHAQGKDISKAAANLVSDEATDGCGNFSIARGTNILGSLSLEQDGDVVNAQSPHTIFHVFSEDFVQEELREKQYTLDGNIENQIAVDSENIRMKDAQEAFINASKAESIAYEAFLLTFETDKVSELAEKAGVNKRLSEYSNLNLDNLFENNSVKPEAPEQAFADILKDLDGLKSIPAEPNYPEAVSSVLIGDISVEDIKRSLEKITSPSSVSEDIKQKIDAHHSFYETGIQIIEKDGQDICPFCMQDSQDGIAKAQIEAYIAYFADEEECHKAELRKFYKALKGKEAEITQLSPKISNQKTRFDALKQYVPSQKGELLSDCEQQIEDLCALIVEFMNVIEAKTKALSANAVLPSGDLAKKFKAFETEIMGNNIKAASLKSAVEASDKERKELQRKACTIFSVEFVQNHWHEFEKVVGLRCDMKEKQNKLAEIEKSSPSSDAKVRVVETFETLLREFFADKYVFDKDNFVLKRGEHHMQRGPHRTLSDGEKTAIAFCYFVASIHRKVKTNSDYQKLFLVFDDPVTSMSYDFVFTITQVLRYLRISKQGEITVKPIIQDDPQFARPELLILTHSSYFFNIAQSNRVVEGASFSLLLKNGEHRLISLNKYIAPFQQQLSHIYEVAHGEDPDLSTGNSIRSVLEAVGRFCRPDQSQSLGKFLSFLAKEGVVAIKSSILINTLSHGSYYDETPSPDDLKLACEETIQVVERYAAGQLEIIRS